MFRTYLDFENARNVKNHRVFMRFLTRALGKKPQMLIGHHIIYIVDGELPNEIPSADTLMFSHELMTAVFGTRAQTVMQVLANRDPELRDKVLEDHLDMLDNEDRLAGREIIEAIA